MQRYMSAVGIAAVALAIPLAVAGRAEADISLTIDNPNITVAVPSSGTSIYTFSGSISVSPTEKITGFGDGSFGVLQFVTAPGFFTYFNSATTGESYTGDLFTITIRPSTPLGLYDGQGSYFLVDASDGSSSTELYSVDVVAAVPEPSTIWVAAGGISAGIAYGWTRRSRKQCR
jgi:hypothetical protein